jgi:hypothetical protein
VLWRLQRWWDRRGGPHASLRRELARWGIDVSHLTDAELEERVVNMARVVSQTGVTAEEAAQALRALATAGPDLMLTNTSGT